MDVLTKQNRIAEIAKKYQDKPLVTLDHHIDLEWMQIAYKKIKPATSPGVDGQTLEMYSENLKYNLQDLRERAISGRYVAPPVKRVYNSEREWEGTAPHRHTHGRRPNFAESSIASSGACL